MEKPQGERLGRYFRPNSGRVKVGFVLRSLTPHSHTHPTRRISAYPGTSRVTTAPAPMKQYFPSVAPQTMVPFALIEAPIRTRVGRYSCFRDTALRGFTTFVNTIEGPQKASLSRVTPSYNETLF